MNRFSFIAMVLIPVAGLGLLTACGKAASSIEPQELQVTAVTGKVEVAIAGSGVSPAQVGMRLGQGAEVRTVGDDSTCTLQSPTGSLIRLAGGSALKLSEMTRDSKQNVEKTSLELVDGKVLVSARKMVDKDEFSVRTRTAVAGVRGTKFVVEYAEATGSRVIVREGKVAVYRPIYLKLPESAKAGEKEVNESIQKETEVFVNPGEDVKVTKADNEALEKTLQKKVEEVVAKGGADAVKVIVTETKKTVIEEKKTMTIEVRKIAPTDTVIKQEFEQLDEMKIKTGESKKEDDVDKKKVVEKKNVQPTYRTYQEKPKKDIR